MPKVDLVDVGGGNIGSVKRCLELMNIEFVAADIANPPGGERPVLLPGVGAFGPVMEHLKSTGFDQRIKDLVNGGTPYLGICVGMQILFDSSEEAPGVAGLGLIPGTVRRFTAGKVPQIGWNLIERSDAEGKQLEATSEAQRSEIPFPESGYVYFVNSFYPDPSSKSDILYSADYHVTFCAAVQSKNITAFQFHPEKSGAFGKTLLTRWVENVA
jgi:glutamine amidotransferase